MNVFIVTVYDSINCGSYWQAFALKEAISEFGCNVYFLKRDKSAGASSSWKSQIKTFLRLCKNKGLMSGVRYKKSLFAFNKIQKTLPVSDEKDIADCFVLGSDTIWNLNSKYFTNHAGTYWGYDFFPSTVITYAVSAANTVQSQVTDDMHQAVGKYKAISVRDNLTRNLILNDTSREIQTVCDPTLLLNKDKYKQWIDTEASPGFVFLYLFKQLSSTGIKLVTSFAKERGLRIVNGGSFDKPEFCDESIVIEPKSFLSHMYMAEYIITDTFHGAIFSANFNKKFVVLNRNKNKVNEFLDLAGIKSRIVNDENDLIDVLQSPIDYRIANMKLESLRMHSLDFLKKSITGVET